MGPFFLFVGKFWKHLTRGGVTPGFCSCAGFLMVRARRVQAGAYIAWDQHISPEAFSLRGNMI